MSDTNHKVLVSLGIDPKNLEVESKAAGFVIQNTLHHTLRGLKHLVGLNLIMVGEHVLHFWEGFSEKLANAIYGNSEVGQERLKKEYEKKMEWYKKEREEREKMAEAAKKKEEERIKYLLEVRKAEDDAYHQYVDERLDKLGENNPKATDLKRRTLEGDVAMAEIDLYQAKAAKDDLKIANAESRLSKLRMDLHKFESDVAAARQAQLKAEQTEAKNLIAGGKYNPTLDKIASLEQDAAFRLRTGDRVTARYDQLEANKLRLSIRDDLRQQKTPKQTAQEQIMGQILDMIGTNKKGIPVKLVDME